jgi:hypothetical protein
MAGGSIIARYSKLMTQALLRPPRPPRYPSRARGESNWCNPILTGAALLASLTVVHAQQQGTARDSGPPVVQPGNGMIDGTRIVPYDNAWSVISRKKDGTIVHVGVATDHVGYITLDNRKYLQRIEGQVDDDGTREDTQITLSDTVTLAPHAGENHGADESVEKRSYDGAHVTIRTAAGAAASEQTHQIELSQPVLDFRGNMAGLILRAQPLRNGYAARIPWADGAGTIHLTEVRVLRREQVDAGMLGKVEAWVVAVGAAPSHVTYWIADKAPYVIRCDIASADGVTSWEMVH